MANKNWDHLNGVPLPNSSNTCFIKQKTKATEQQQNTHLRVSLWLNQMTVQKTYGDLSWGTMSSQLVEEGYYWKRP